MIRSLLCTLALLCLIPGEAAALTPLPPQPEDVAWPTASWAAGPLPVGADEAALAALVEEAFDNPDADALPGTRALLVIHRGQIVAEHYAPGFHADRKFLTQSVAKTVTGALAGIAVRDGLLTLDEPAPVALWRGEDDPRRAITLRHLLQMSDGLDFTESYFNPFTSDVLPMLFGHARDDMAGWAADRPLAHAPGTHWSYSSGTTNILSGIIRDAVGGTRAQYLSFMRRELFEPIGMTSAEPEFDAAGTFVGSSWLHATARDWARFGLLLLRGGVWDGRRILPEGWVDFMRTPLPHEPDKIYGAHLWLNGGGRIPGAPDLFMATGNGGQVIAMVPSRDLVIVRLGRTDYSHYAAIYRWIGDIVALFPAR